MPGSLGLFLSGRSGGGRGSGGSALRGEPAEAQALPGYDGLAPGTREELEETAGSPCPAALAELELPSASEVRRVDVHGHQARVVLDAETLFLSAFRDGWKAVAAACLARPGLPYQCDRKGG